MKIELQFWLSLLACDSPIDEILKNTVIVYYKKLMQQQSDQ